MELMKVIKALPGNLRRVTSNSGYIHEVDGLRFIAILPVVLMHCSERIAKYGVFSDASVNTESLGYVLSRGTVGVFVFFAISGFILGLPFARSYRNRIKVKPYPKFILRRLTRLEPPYILWMAFCMVVLLVKGSYAADELIRHFAASVLYVHNWVYHSYSIINPVAWSLEVEFQFYLIAPVLAFVFFKSRRRLVSRFVLVLLIVGWPVLKSTFGWNIMPYKASLLGHLDHFMAGFLFLEMYLSGKKRRFGLPGWGWDVIGILAYSTLFFTWRDEIAASVVFNICLVLILKSAFAGSMVNYFMNRPWICAIGGMCYTIYLIHLPLFELLSWALTGLMSKISAGEYMLIILIQLTLVLVVTIPAYLLFERPFMENKMISNWRSLFSKVRLSGLQLLRRGAGILLVLCVTLVPLSAQDMDAEPGGEPIALLSIDPSSPELIHLKPLHQIIAYAELNSPLLKSSDLRTQDLDEALKLIKNEWTEYIFFNATYNYGTSAFLDQTETPQIVDFRTVNRKLSLYNVGVSLRIPLSSIAQRGPKTRQIELQKQIESLTRDEVFSNVRKEVIREYNTFRNKIKVIAVKNEKAQSLRLAAEYAEQLLQDGQLDLVEYTTIITRKSQTIEELENLRAEALLAYLILHDICGGNITE